jgi:hypothetical protein
MSKARSAIVAVACLTLAPTAAVAQATTVAEHQYMPFT